MKKPIFVAVLLAGLILTGCSGGQKTPDGTPTDSIDLGLADGSYTVDFETDSSMFRANEATEGKGTLTVTDGEGTVHVSLASQNIVNLYLGTAEDAKEHEDLWLQPTVDTVTYSDGLSEDVFGFDIPVSVIGEDFDLAIVGKKGTWYDHKVSVQNPEPVAETAVLADGTYQCAVSLEGGSGRASVESPATITVDGDTVTATIVWSSPYYEYMLVGDVQYDPIQTAGNSTFEIPVVLDEEMDVSASTIAMSEPHLVTYTLHFDSTTIQ